MNQFGIFAKYWTAGRVKTRLAASIGEPAAAEFHHTCVETLLSRFENTGDRRVIGFAPPERENEFQTVAGKSWTATAQVAGNLGERMSEYFREAFAMNMTRVLLIGSDSPTMPQSVIDSAFESLKSVDVVVGPTNDGGYYLIGMSTYRPEIFEDIEWSTGQVWQQTRDRIESNGISFKELPAWYDIDNIDDLKRLHQELQSDLKNDSTDDVFASLRQVVAANQ